MHILVFFPTEEILHIHFTHTYAEGTQGCYTEELLKAPWGFVHTGGPHESLGAKPLGASYTQMHILVFSYRKWKA